MTIQLLKEHVMCLSVDENIRRIMPGEKDRLLTIAVPSSVAQSPIEHITVSIRLAFDFNAPKDSVICLNFRPYEKEISKDGGTTYLHMFVDYPVFDFESERYFFNGWLLESGEWFKNYGYKHKFIEWVVTQPVLVSGGMVRQFGAVHPAPGSIIKHIRSGKTPIRWKEVIIPHYPLLINANKE